jgi:MoaA/NifB/PqqE/SkfB family radical SAM enzyme
VVAGRLAAAGVSYIGISVDGRPETHHGFRASPGAPLRLTGAGYQVRGVPGGVETRGVNGGKGFMFIDHVGNFCPSGFLQLAAANVRTDSLTNVYRQAPLFRELRDPAALRGRCGRCRYADLRGGSRARASAVNGSHLADDPLCGLHEEAIACASHRFAE